MNMMILQPNLKGMMVIIKCDGNLAMMRSSMSTRMKKNSNDSFATMKKMMVIRMEMTNNDTLPILERMVLVRMNNCNHYVSAFMGNNDDDNNCNDAFAMKK